MTPGTPKEMETINKIGFVYFHYWKGFVIRGDRGGAGGFKFFLVAGTYITLLNEL